MRRRRIVRNAAVLVLLIAALSFLWIRPARMELQLILQVRSLGDERLYLWINRQETPQGDSVKAGERQTVQFRLPRMPIEHMRLQLGNGASPPEILSLRISGPLNLSNRVWAGRSLEKVFNLREMIRKKGTEARRWLTPVKPFYPMVSDLQRNRIYNGSLAVLSCLVFMGIAHNFNRRILLFRFPRRALTWGGIVFLLFIYSLSAASILKISGFASLEEKRTLAHKPELRLNSILQFPREYTAYYLDNFPLRSDLIVIHNLIILKGLKVSPNPQVLIGKDGWMFSDGPGEFPGSTDYYRSLDLFSSQELERWTTLLEQRRRWLEAREVQYLLVIAPNGNTIYPEFMPDRIRKVRKTSRLDQLLEYLKIHSQVIAPDLRPALIAAKSDHPVYFKTDTHWNDFGAYIAVGEILKSASRFFPGASPLPLSRFKVDSFERKSGDLALLAGLDKTRIRERSICLIPDPALSFKKTVITPRYIYTERPDAPLPGVVFVGDSFYERLVPFLSEQCSRVYYIEDGYSHFYSEIIDKEKPKLVIDELTERKLMGSIPPNPEHIIKESPSREPSDHK